MNDDFAADTRKKALALNLDASTYGTFAEIGGGQEVARWFFSVGGAAGTVAKSISAYDMAVSDSLYGPTRQYVSRQRLEAMLDREFRQVVETLGPARGAAKRFFAFANTAATRSFRGGGSGRGWMGVRFQAAPGTRRPTSSSTPTFSTPPPPANRTHWACSGSTWSTPRSSAATTRATWSPH